MLRTAQRDWLKFRDSHCGFEAGEYESGSMQPLIYAACLTACTRKRIEDLKAGIEDRNH